MACHRRGRKLGTDLTAPWTARGESPRSPGPTSTSPTPPRRRGGRGGRAGRRDQLRGLDRRRRRRGRTRPRRRRQRPRRGHLAAACAEAGAPLVHLSTDYVFAGDATRPVRRGRADRAGGRLRPDQAGRRAGGAAALPDASYVVRTAWLYGRTARTSSGRCRASPASGTAPGVVDDQHGQPTWTADLAAQVHALVEKAAPPGTYHATSSGETTWYGFAEAIFARCHRDQELRGPNGSSFAPSCHYRRVPDAGPAGLQRPRPRRLARGGHRAHRRLAGRAGPRVPGDRGGLAVPA